MPVTKLKGSWWVEFMYNRERMRKRSPENSKAGAQAFEAYLRQQIAQHGSVAKVLAAMRPSEETRKPTFAEFSERWMRDYVSANNKATSQKEKRHALDVHLLPAFGALRLAEITSSEVERYKASKRSLPLSAKSVNNHLTILRKCLDTAIEWGELQALPRIKFLKTEEPPFRFLSEDQANRLIAASPHGLWRALVTTALRTGLRFSELVALQWGDISWTVGSHGQLSVRRSNVRGVVGPPKNNRVRHVPLTSETAAELTALATPGAASDDLVFTFEGRYLRYDTAWKHLTKICRAATVPRVSWHDLRHTFASHLVSAGAPLKGIQDLLGHSTIEMTMRYAHLSPDVRHSTIALLEPRTAEKLPACYQPALPNAHLPHPAIVLQGSNLGSM